VFLYLEARRYRYFNVWRARARWLEIHFYASILRRENVDDPAWRTRLAQDYERPEHHIEFRRALGRRLRRNYMWIYSVQTLSLFGKVAAPEGGPNFQSLHLGPVPGEATAAFAALAYIALAVFTISIWRLDKRRFAQRLNPLSMG
jgi:uncharacterized membrane protein